MGWLTLRLPIPISANHHYQVMRGRVVLTDAARAYRSEVWAMVMEQTTPEQRAALPERLTLSLVVHPSCRLDVGNIEKEVSDAIFAALGRDDRTIWHLQVDRSEAAERGVVGVQIGGGE